ncbi:MAG: alpha/beta fold hydrolase [Rhodocyclaceae bacterium]|nr:alpha/beta fold hydrolase [Rhodocyclaceae bacterium]
MTKSAERITIAGEAGALELLIEAPAHILGIGLVAHPHPLFGGTMDNKVAFTLARALRDLGYVAVRSNFRGVGQSEGEHDDGQGETEDMLRVLDYARSRFGDLPVALAGFSFGAYVQTLVAKRLKDEGRPIARMVLVGTAAGMVTGARHYVTEGVPPDALVIHGDKDETVPLENVIAWAQPQELPIVLVPGADHFFHGKLHTLKAIIHRAWAR